MRKSKSQQISPNIHNHLLKDYTFLHDYIIIDIEPNHITPSAHVDQPNQAVDVNQPEIFGAQIMGTDQLVKFNKIPYHDSLIGRFQALVDLYQRGAVLADNLFILQETGKLYFYVIQAYIPKQIQQVSPLMSYNKTFNTSPSASRTFTPSHNISQISLISPSSRFITLSQMISTEAYAQQTLEWKIKMIDRIKILLQCVHQTGQAYAELTPDHIIIDIEDEESVYLVPFHLKVQIGGSSNKVNRSYLAPEILEIEGRHQKSRQIKIEGERMMKADIWAFGCIMLEILFYSSPVFYAVNSSNQMRQINDFLQADKKTVHSLKNCIAKLVQTDENNNNLESIKSRKKQQPGVSKIDMLTNLLLNCLQIDASKRILTSQRGVTACSMSKIEQTNRTPRNVSKAVPQNSREEADSGDSELTLYLMHVCNVEIKKEMRINIHIDRRHCIFVSDTDCISKQSTKNVYAIDKCVKVRSTFEKFYQILSQPIRIQLIEDAKSCQIFVNLSTLILENEGERIWNKPIIGSYTCRNTIYFRDATLKIKSEITCNGDQIQFGANKLKNELTQIKQKAKENRRTHNITKTIAKEDKQNRQQIATKPKQISKVALPLQPLNYFDKINQSLQQICQKWKSKSSNQKSLKELTSPQNRSEEQKKRENKNQNPVEVPISLWSSRQVQITGSEREEEKDSKIDRKIKDMLAKLQIK